MPSGNELVFGFHAGTHKNLIDKFLAKYKITFDEDELDLFGSHLSKIQKDLDEAHTKALQDKGFTPYMGKGKKTTRPEYKLYNTPKGIREFGPWGLCYLINDEYEDRKEDYVFGVPISSRYFPTFADWQDIGGTLYPIVFDGDLQQCMDIAKKRILEVLPEFKDAVWIVKEIWY